MVHAAYQPGGTLALPLLTELDDLPGKPLDG